MSNKTWWRYANIEQDATELDGQYMAMEWTTSMLLTIEQLNKNKFVGRAEYPALGNTITKVTGQVLEQGVNTAVTYKWSQIPGVILRPSERVIKFTEPEHINGSHTQLNGWYYGIIENNGRLVGIWFPKDGDDPKPVLNWN